MCREFASYIAGAWSLYKRHFRIIFGAQLAYLAIILAVILAGIMPLISALRSKTFVVMEGGGNPALAELVKQVADAAILEKPLIIFAVAVLIAIVAAIALAVGRVGIYSDILRKRKSSVSIMFSVAKKKFWASLGSAVITAVIVLLAAAALVIVTAPLAAAGTFVVELLLFLDILALVLFSILFNLTRQAIVIGNCTATESVIESYRLVKRNYPELLCLVAVVAFLAAILSFLPVLGNILILFVVQPVAEIAYTAFYMDKAKRKAVR